MLSILLWNCHSFIAQSHTWLNRSLIMMPCWAGHFIALQEHNLTLHSCTISICITLFFTFVYHPSNNLIFWIFLQPKKCKPKNDTTASRHMPCISSNLHIIIFRPIRWSKIFRALMHNVVNQGRVFGMSILAFSWLFGWLQNVGVSSWRGTYFFLLQRISRCSLVYRFWMMLMNDKFLFLWTLLYVPLLFRDLAFCSEQPHGEAKYNHIFLFLRWYHFICNTFVTLS